MESFTKLMIVLGGGESYIITNKLCTEILLLSIDVSMTRVIDRVVPCTCVHKMMQWKKNWTCSDTHILLYADDILLYRVVSSSHDYDMLQCYPQGFAILSSLVLITSHNHAYLVWGSQGFTRENRHRSYYVKSMGIRVMTQHFCTCMWCFRTPSASRCRYTFHLGYFQQLVSQHNKVQIYGDHKT